MALSKTTQDHDEIQRWAEARGAVPSEVTSTAKKGEPGILRFEFPNAKNANDNALNEISWDEFFEKFDASGLALVYQEKTAGGQKSNFNKLVHPENAKPKAKKSTAKSSSSGHRTTKKASAKSAKTTSTARRKTVTKTGSTTRRRASAKR
ncbi:MAG TPA: hypothetical protein VFE38_01610 [Edaphobacter sp.]|nr:hypothetical protein [Edaphobacter sp.]